MGWVVDATPWSRYPQERHGGTESGGTRRRTGGEVKGKEANEVGNQQSSA